MLVPFILLLAGCHTALSPALTADDYTLAGIAKAGQHDHAGAVADFKHALALHPDDANTLLNLGLAQIEHGDYVAARAAFDRALALSPGDAGLWLSRGSAKFYLEDYPGAVADYDRALALDPAFATAYYARALAKRRQLDYAGAFADYDRTLALDPASWLAYNGRATTRNAHGDFELALPDYQRRIELRPEDAQYVWFERSLVLRRLGRPDQEALAQEVARWPEDWPRTVGEFLLGQMSAGELLRLAVAPDDPQTRREQLCEANYYVGMVALLAGRPTEARERFLACRATGINVFLEFLLAGAELARLDAVKP